MHMYLLQPDTITGDIVFVLQVKDHPKFRREQDDLVGDIFMMLEDTIN